MEQDTIAHAYATREFLWVIKVIKSCKHPAQLEICEALLSLFQKQQDDVVTAQKIKHAFDDQAVKLNYFQYAGTKKSQSLK